MGKARRQVQRWIVRFGIDADLVSLDCAAAVACRRCSRAGTFRRPAGQVEPRSRPAVSRDSLRDSSRDVVAPYSHATARPARGRRVLPLRGGGVAGGTEGAHGQARRASKETTETAATFQRCPRLRTRSGRWRSSRDASTRADGDGWSRALRESWRPYARRSPSCARHGTRPTRGSPPRWTSSSSTGEDPSGASSRSVASRFATHPRRRARRRRATESMGVLPPDEGARAVLAMGASRRRRVLTQTIDCVIGGRDARARAIEWQPVRYSLRNARSFHHG